MGEDSKIFNTYDSEFSPRTSFLVIGAVLFGLVIFYLGYQITSSRTNISPPLINRLSPTPIEKEDEVASWKHYSNSQYNFEFKYPLIFTPTPKTTDNQIFTLMDNSNTKSRLSTIPDVFIRILPLESEQDYKSVLVNDVIFDGSGSHPKSFEEFSSKEINNNTVYLIQTGNFEGILTYNYYLINRKNIIAFTVTSSPIDWTNPDYKPENDPLNQNFQQILSTFKFLDNTNSTPTPNPQGKFCGGIAANLSQNKCPQGFKCKLDGNYPDAGGKCVRE